MSSLSPTTFVYDHVCLFTVILLRCEYSFVGEGPTTSLRFGPLKIALRTTGNETDTIYYADSSRLIYVILKSFAVLTVINSLLS